jgi:DNA-binding response OmpR family regulator
MDAGQAHTDPSWTKSRRSEEVGAMRVVLADDHRDVRAAMRLLLEQEGATIVAEVFAADTLLTGAAQAQPDLVLLDWELPGMPVEDLVGGLRDLCPGTVIVALSGRLEARAEALAAGADAFVSKADPPESLLAIIRVGVWNANESAGAAGPAAGEAGKSAGATGPAA